MIKEIGDHYKIDIKELKMTQLHDLVKSTMGDNIDVEKQIISF